MKAIVEDETSEDGVKLRVSVSNWNAKSVVVSGSFAKLFIVSISLTSVVVLPETLDG